jgi:hypothetical protein
MSGIYNIPGIFYIKEIKKMKRVNIETAGIIVTFRGSTPVRTPTFIDVDDKDLDSLKMYLNILGVRKYTVNVIAPEDIKKPKQKKKKKGLKEVIITGSTNRSVKLNIG